MKKIIILFMLFSTAIKAQEMANIYKISRHFTTSEVLTLNTSPVNFGIPTPGPGKYIVIIEAVCDFHFNTTPFNANSMYLFTSGAVESQAILGLGFTNSAFTRFSIQTGSDNQFVANQGVLLLADMNSSVGDCDFDIYITYRIVDETGTTAQPIFDTIITLTSPQILSLFTTPVTVIPSPGASKTIQVVEATATVNFNTTAYVGGGNLRLITNTANFPQFHCSAFTASGNTKRLFIAQQATSAGDTQIIANQGLLAKASSGDPTTGNSTITIRIFYRILDY